MTLLWPGFLVLLLLMPAARRARTCGSCATGPGRPCATPACRSSRPPGHASSRVRRHLPFALFLAAVAGRWCSRWHARRPWSACPPARPRSCWSSTSPAACARPTSSPAGSLAAEAAASDFIEQQGSTTQIGIVAFSGFAELIQAPTTDTGAAPGRGAQPHDRPAHGRRQRHPDGHRCHRRDRPERGARGDRSTRPPSHPTPVVPGAYAPAIIVVLTDGASNAGAPTRRMRPSRPPTAACASTPSASARPRAAVGTRLRPVVRRPRAERRRSGFGGGQAVGGRRRAAGPVASGAASTRTRSSRSPG